MLPCGPMTTQERADLEAEYEAIAWPHTMTTGSGRLQFWRRVHRDGRIETKEGRAEPWHAHSQAADPIVYLDRLRAMGWKSETK